MGRQIDPVLVSLIGAGGDMVLQQDRVTFRFRLLAGAQEIHVFPAALWLVP